VLKAHESFLIKLKVPRKLTNVYLDEFTNRSGKVILTHTRASARRVPRDSRRNVDLSRTRRPAEKLPSERFSSDIPLTPRLFSNVCLNLPLLPP